MFIALMAAMLLTALGSATVLLTTVETAISANYRNGQETLYAADAGIEHVLQDLLAASDWSAVLSGQMGSSFVDSTMVPTLPNGALLDLSAETSRLQQDTDTANVWGANDPIWRLYAWGAVDDLLPGTEVNSSNYIAVWVGDDPSETDGDALSDANGVLTIRVEAFGPFNTRKVVEATVARGSTSDGGDDSDDQRRREPPEPDTPREAERETLARGYDGAPLGRCRCAGSGQRIPAGEGV